MSANQFYGSSAPSSDSKQQPQVENRDYHDQNPDPTHPGADGERGLGETVVGGAGGLFLGDKFGEKLGLGKLGGKVGGAVTVSFFFLSRQCDVMLMDYDC